MGKAKKNTYISFRVDDNLKKEADELFENLGLSTSAVLNSFLVTCVRQQEIPYKISMKAPEPSAELKEALKEADDILSGKVKAKGYHNVRQMIEDILNED